jgi:DinB superfamily
MDTVSFFVLQHADLHSREIAGRDTYFDRVFGGLSDDVMRVRPAKGLNSLVWLLWHMARTEDVSVNLVVANATQVFDDAWSKRMNAPWRLIGTGMTDDEVSELTTHADVAAVRAYRDAVGRRTQDVVRALRPDAWDETVVFADTARAHAAGAFRTGWQDGVGFRGWQDQSRGARLHGGALRHNALHMGEAITVRGLAGAGVGM